MTIASLETGRTTGAASPPPWADDPGMARAVTWYEANRHREDLPMLLREWRDGGRLLAPPVRKERK